jgi:hypothetical protein
MKFDGAKLPPRVKALVQRQRWAWRQSTSLVALVALGVALGSAWTLADDVHVTGVEAMVQLSTFIVAGLAIIAVAESMPGTSTVWCCSFLILTVPLYNLWQAADAALTGTPTDCQNAEVFTVRPA